VALYTWVYNDVAGVTQGGHGAPCYPGSSKSLRLYTSVHQMLGLVSTYVHTRSTVASIMR
jgi:hypothetical protein